ncbi:NADase-type glycan-binding domain-containing protein [Geodermatophilus sp. SYSU D01105]
MDDAVLACAGCAHALEPGDRFCEACGTPVVVAGPPLGPAVPEPPLPPVAAPAAAPQPLVPPAAAPPAAPAVVPAHTQLTLELPPGPSLATELPAHLSPRRLPGDRGPRTGGVPWTLVAPVLVLLVGAAVVVGIVWPRSDPSAAAAPAPSAPTVPGEVPEAAPYSPTAQDSSATEPTGNWTRYATATAPATSPDNVDSAGRPTSYRAGNMLDGKPATTWRMDGDGSGRLITFRFDRAVPVSTVGLVNGYAKVDPATGENRYAQGRRITRVTWFIGDQAVVQQLRDGVRDVQTVDFPAVTTDVVRLQIERTTAPGAAGFDRTAISDVLIANP